MRVLLLGSLVFLLSGCVAGESDTGDGYIRFDGTGEDTWSTHANGCGTSEILSVSKDGTGSVTVTVLDAADEQVFKDSVGGTGAASRTFTVQGIPGTWTLKASTSGSFAGDLDVSLGC